LMGGQACVLYGAAEFSRDLDLVLVPDPANLARLESALEDLEAERIAVPPFAPEYLEGGLAVHFPMPPSGRPGPVDRRDDALARRRSVSAAVGAADASADSCPGRVVRGRYP
jgi:hypothetical protein